MAPNFTGLAVDAWAVSQMRSYSSGPGPICPVTALGILVSMTSCMNSPGCLPWWMG